MPKPRLKPEYESLERDIIETMLAGLKQWRPDLKYPESHSDMQGCVMALLRMYEVKRRPIALNEKDLLFEYLRCKHGNEFEFLIISNQTVQLACGCVFGLFSKPEDVRA